MMESNNLSMEINNELFLEIYDLWNKYHLKNYDMIDSEGIERINRIFELEKIHNQSPKEK